MTQKIDMSPDAVTGRMIALDQLWQLSVALRSSRIVEEDSTEPPSHESSLPRHDTGEPGHDLTDVE